VRHPLARAVNRLGLDAVDLAARLGVDPKTVERWFAGRVPYPRYRATLAALTGWDERDLWPTTARSVTQSGGADEVRVAYARRSAIPASTWHRLFGQAQHAIDVLNYSGLFLAEDVDALKLLRERASSGVAVRIAIGDPDGVHPLRRGEDEGIGDVILAKIRNSIALYRSILDHPGVQVRLHDTVLYASIYRADDEILVNAHVYGLPASQAPVLHLRRVSEDGMAATYLRSFETIWTDARPLS
jgi:hypothetical protein